MSKARENAVQAIESAILQLDFGDVDAATITLCRAMADLGAEPPVTPSKQGCESMLYAMRCELEPGHSGAHRARHIVRWG